MKKNSNYSESTYKIIFFILLLFSTSAVSKEVFPDKWTYACDARGVCYIGIINEVPTPNAKKKKQTFATMSIQLASQTDRQMNLVDGEEKTYKLEENKKNVPIMFVNLPLNTDLKKKPLVTIDKKNTGYLTYTKCNNEEGCVTNSLLNDNIIKQLRDGAEISVTFGLTSGKNMTIKFPLKQFSKSYKKLIK
jgi:invasion protein IalB